MAAYPDTDRDEAAVVTVDMNVVPEGSCMSHTRMIVEVVAAWQLRAPETPCDEQDIMASDCAALSR